MSLAAIDPFNRFENKDQPKPVARTKIVEAYGLRKCPKLVEQICSNTLEVRNNALNVLCNEFENPYSVEQTGRVGVVGILAGMVIDSDFTTRVRATLALSLAARDANGVKAILEATAVPSILTAIQDKSEVVRGNVYGCLLHICRLNTGVAACVEAGTVQVLVQVLRDELDEMKPTILQTLYKLVGNEQGLLAAINANAVDHFIKLLQRGTSETAPLASEHESRIILECSKALGFLCYDGRAKQAALDCGAIGELINILKLKAVGSNVKAAITVAIMAITITDDGKIQMYTHDGPDVIMPLLYDDDPVVVLNSLKIISSIAVYPKNRVILLEDSTCTTKIRKLVKSDNAAIGKHATIALNAVTWQP